MSKCSGCLNGLQSSECIEYNEDLTVKESLTEIYKKLEDIDKKFYNTVDGKTLSTGSDLIKTLQKIIDIFINKNNKNTLYNVEDLLDDCNNSIRLNQEELNSIFIQEIIKLKNK